MSFEVSRIDQNQFNKILQAEESHFLDLKSININPGKLSRSISGFANADGGELYIGIDENDVENKKIRSWRGFSDQEAANGHLQVFEGLFPFGDGYSCVFLASEEATGLVLQITISKSGAIINASDDKPYIRVGAQTLPVKDAVALQKLKLAKGLESFEKQTVDANIELISESQIMKKFMISIIPNADPETWLKKQQLIKNNKPTLAGILLFSDEPQAILPKRSGVKIYRYKTKESEGTRETLDFNPITIEGCLYQQIELSVSTTIKIVEEIPKLGKDGLEKIAYPAEAIHEIITNALLHRDYSIASDIFIRIFDNRIEIESPGKLPGHITVNNILREQFARNGAIVRIINKFPNPPNKDVGEGLNTAFQAMARLRLKPPEIHETENSVLVYIKHEPLASVETRIMDYLETHSEITNQIARRITGIRSEGTIKDAFYRLRDAGLIEPVHGRPKNKAAWCKAGALHARSKNLNINSKYEDLYPEYEKIIMQYLEEHEEINNSQARNIIGINSSADVRNVFNRLQRKKRIEIVPGTTRINASWRKIQSINQDEN